MRFFLLVAGAVILVRDPTGKWAGDPLKPWFDDLHNQAGQFCCSDADGHPVDDGDWDMKDNRYRVIVQVDWTVVPDDAIVSGPNKFGKAVVWLWNLDELGYATPNSRMLSSGIGSLRARLMCFFNGPWSWKQR
jgi:hypothetical protein